MGLLDFLLDKGILSEKDVNDIMTVGEKADNWIKGLGVKPESPQLPPVQARIEQGFSLPSFNDTQPAAISAQDNEINTSNLLNNRHTADAARQYAIETADQTSGPSSQISRWSPNDPGNTNMPPSAGFFGARRRDPVIQSIQNAVTPKGPSLWETASNLINPGVTWKGEKKDRPYGETPPVPKEQGKEYPYGAQYLPGDIREAVNEAINSETPWEVALGRAQKNRNRNNAWKDLATGVITAPATGPIVAYNIAKNVLGGNGDVLGNVPAVKAIRGLKNLVTGGGEEGVSNEILGEIAETTPGLVSNLPPELQQRIQMMQQNTQLLNEANGVQPQQQEEEDLYAFKQMPLPRSLEEGLALSPDDKVNVGLTAFTTNSAMLSNPFDRLNALQARKSLQDYYRTQKKAINTKYNEQIKRLGKDSLSSELAQALTAAKEKELYDLGDAVGGALMYGSEGEDISNRLVSLRDDFAPQQVNSQGNQEQSGDKENLPPVTGQDFDLPGGGDENTFFKKNRGTLDLNNPGNYTGDPNSLEFEAPEVQIISGQPVQVEKVKGQNAYRVIGVANPYGEMATTMQFNPDDARRNLQAIHSILSALGATEEDLPEVEDMYTRSGKNIGLQKVKFKFNDKETQKAADETLRHMHRIGQEAGIFGEGGRIGLIDPISLKGADGEKAKVLLDALSQLNNNQFIQELRNLKSWGGTLGPVSNQEGGRLAGQHGQLVNALSSSEMLNTLSYLYKVYSAMLRYREVGY